MKILLNKLEADNWTLAQSWFLFSSEKFETSQK